jgi:trk system potassium uptake protein TrkA
MKQFAIIGLSYFGRNVLEELLALDVDVLIIDKDREVVDAYRDAPLTAVVLDVLNEESLRHVLPKTIDAVVIDLGERIEASILATSYCRKLGVKTIIVKAETEAHAEILDLVGATKIVFPNKEAAKRITPLMTSSALLNYLPVSGNLVIAELELPERFVGKTVVETDLRKKYGLNLISVKNGEEEEYGLFLPDYRFRKGDVALVSGTDEALEAFAGRATKETNRGSLIRSLKRLFGHDKK